MVMTREEVESKLQMVENELKEIELTNDKSRRLRWRELNKIKKHYKSLLLSSEYHMEQQLDDIYQIEQFIEGRLKWNTYWKNRDPKASDFGRIEEDKCILRFIDHLKEKKNNGNDRH